MVDFSKHNFDTNFEQEVPNPDFIFHNKLPKAGSSTMNNIFRLLAKRNNFNSSSDYFDADS